MRVSGFYRLVQSFPSPVVPLFQREASGAHFAQIFDSKGLVSSFQEAEELDTDRMMVEGRYEGTSIEVGDKGLYAVAYSEGHLLVNTADVVRREIREFLYARDAGTPLFAALELALFTGDAALIEERAELCRRKLQTSAPAVTSLWIDGAPLGESLKWKLRNRQIQLEGSEPPKPASVRFGFIGPHRLMIGLTDFCINNVRQTRATVVRKLFSGSDVAKRIAKANARIDGILLDLTDRYRLKDGRFATESWSVSRGQITVPIFDTTSYAIAKSNFSTEVSNSQHYRAISSAPYYSRGIESSNFILLVAMLLEFQEEFESFYARMMRWEVRN